MLIISGLYIYIYLKVTIVKTFNFFFALHQYACSSVLLVVYEFCFIIKQSSFGRKLFGHYFMFLSIIIIFWYLELRSFCCSRPFIYVDLITYLCSSEKKYSFSFISFLQLVFLLFKVFILYVLEILGGKCLRNNPSFFVNGSCLWTVGVPVLWLAF